MTKTKCSRTGVPFEFDRLINSGGTYDIHPQLLIPAATAARELESIACMDSDRPYTKRQLTKVEHRLRLCSYVFAAHHGLLDSDSPIRPLGFIKRSEPLDEYGSPRDVKMLSADASALLAIPALVSTLPKMRELHTGMWSTALTEALLATNGTGQRAAEDLSFAADASMTHFLVHQIGQSSFVSPREMHTYLADILKYTQFAEEAVEFFNAVYTAYQLLALPADCEAVVTLLPKVGAAPEFLELHSVDAMVDAVAKGKIASGLPPDWRVGNALFKAFRKLRDYEPEIQEPEPKPEPVSRSMRLKFQLVKKENADV